MKSKYSIVFSIPIHEKFEVVIDQIINIKRFNPNSAIVFHVSQKFDYQNSKIDTREFYEIIKLYDGVYVNSNQLRTGWADIIQAHISNYDFIKQKIAFDYFFFMASNELFIREGLEEKVYKYDCAIGKIEKKSVPDWSWWNDSENDSELNNMLYSINPNARPIGTQIEGCYFSQVLFEEITRIIKKYYDWENMKNAYPREEVYFSSIVWNQVFYKNQNIKIQPLLNGNCANAFMPWTRFQYKVTMTDIYRILKKDNFYSVKRVDRYLNNYLRAYIRKKFGYNEEERNLGLLVHNNYPIICYWIKDLYSQIYILVGDMKRKKNNNN